MATTSRKEREVKERELRLLDVARKMLIQEGYARLSLERLAEATEYSKGTIYLHFKTKEDLVMALASQTMEQRTMLFERVGRFRGRPREKMFGIGIADELFARLYPHAFRSELIIKMADLEERASDTHKLALHCQESQCVEMLGGIIREGVAMGDLPPTVSPPRIMSALLMMVIGAHTLVANFGSLLQEFGVTEPYNSLRENTHLLLDSFQWKPLSTEWDYSTTYRRFTEEIFAHEYQSAGHG